MLVVRMMTGYGMYDAMDGMQLWPALGGWDRAMRERKARRKKTLGRYGKDTMG